MASLRLSRPTLARTRAGRLSTVVWTGVWGRSVGDWGRTAHRGGSRRRMPVEHFALPQFPQAAASPRPVAARSVADIALPFIGE